MGGKGGIAVTRRIRRNDRKRFTILLILFLLAAAGFLVLFIHGNYGPKLLIKLGIMEPEEDYAHSADPRTAAGWDLCLEQLGVDADVVFFGDSLTHHSDFTAYFPDLTICNFGVDSDTLTGMMDRVHMLKTVHPEVVFFLGGINSLKKDNFDSTLSDYALLVRLMRRRTDAKIYLLSILPISRDRVADPTANEMISRFNRAIAALAEAEGAEYIDLASHFLLDGEMNPALTTDGVHLTQAGYDLWAEVIAPYLP